MRYVLAVTLLLANSETLNGQQKPTGPLQLTLPPAIYAVAGVPTSVYFDNIVLSEDISNYRFDVTCDVGQVEERRWNVASRKTDIGIHTVKFSVFADDGRLVDSKSTILNVIPANAGATQQATRLLIIGDSLTNASAYPNEIARLLSQPGNPEWSMLGTHKPTSAAEDVVHEGYSGWTWERFVTAYESHPDGTHRKRSSPFVFLNDNGKPQLDVSRYFEESYDGQRPDYIVILLGINDCFHVSPDDAAAVDARVDRMFGYAERLLSAIRLAAPDVHIGLCLTTPPNARQEAFQANYKDRYSRWGWKRIQHRLVQRQIDYVARKEDFRLSIIPTQLNIDPVDGYPENNGVHPNASGYRHIGTSIYSWLKWRFAQTPTSARPQTRKQPPSVLRPITDTPGLPRVLLIGDSISIGYTLPTRELLRGKANVHRIPANGGPTTRGLANIDRWLGNGKWDVIHFNWGIHDLRHMADGKRQVEPADYAKNLRKLIARLKKTNAKLVWAATTPIPQGKLKPDRTFGSEVEYNQIAAKIMGEQGIAINDLHGYILPRFKDLQRPMDLHYKPQGSEHLAQRVAETIGTLLP